MTDETTGGRADRSSIALEREAARLTREYNRRWVESLVGEELDREDDDAE